MCAVSQVGDQYAQRFLPKEEDERNNEPNCEMEQKMALLRKIAEVVGVNLDDVIGPAAAT